MHALVAISALCGVGRLDKMGIRTKAPTLLVTQNAPKRRPNEDETGFGFGYRRGGLGIYGDYTGPYCKLGERAQIRIHVSGDCGRGAGWRTKGLDSGCHLGRKSRRGPEGRLEPGANLGQ